MGVLLLLSTLGLAIGISTADIGAGRDLNAKGLGIGAGIWSGVSLLIALFIGGMIASRVEWSSIAPPGWFKAALYGCWRLLE